MGLLGAIFGAVRSLICRTEPSKPEFQPEQPPHESQHQWPEHSHPGAYPAKPVQPVKPPSPPTHRPPKPPSPGRIHKRYVGSQFVSQRPTLNHFPG